jgi:hypothetical protein
LWQLLGKTKNPLAGLGAERRSLLLAAAVVFVGSFGMTAQLVVPGSCGEGLRRTEKWIMPPPPISEDTSLLQSIIKPRPSQAYSIT